MKLRVSLLCVLLTALLYGCGQNELTNIDIVRVPLVGNYWLDVPIDGYAKLISSDSYVVWLYDNGMNITKYAGASGVHTVETPGTATWYNTDLDVSLSFSGNRAWVAYIKDHKDELVLHEGAVKLEKENRIGAWSSLDGLTYVETKSGVWMPGEFSYNTWLMPVYRKDLSYFATSVKHWNEEEVQLACLGYLAANDEGKVLWSTEKYGMIFRNDKVGVGYKKITENKYIWYIASRDMFDYVVLNVQKGE